MQWDELIDSARRVLKNAYAPYSGVHVAAAVATELGVFTGINVENASYGLSMCAERVAIFNAVSAGARDIRAIVVLTDRPNIVPPCGACRQVMAEFNPDLEVLLMSTTGLQQETTLKELLPSPFGASHISKD